MSRALTNKQLVVLAVLRRTGGPMTAQDIADIVSKETPCGECGGSGEGDALHWSQKTGKREPVCPRCYGRGTAFFCYSRAYQALQRLLKTGLVTRRCKRDEWGDELALHVYQAAPVEADPADPLERLWSLATTREGGEPH